MSKQDRLALMCYHSKNFNICVEHVEKNKYIVVVVDNTTKESLEFKEIIDDDPLLPEVEWVAEELKTKYIFDLDNIFSYGKKSSRQKAA